MALQTVVVPVGFTSGTPEVVPNPAEPPPLFFRVRVVPDGQGGYEYAVYDKVETSPTVSYISSQVQPDNGYVSIDMAMHGSVEEEQTDSVRLRFDYPSTASALNVHYTDNGFGTRILTFRVPMVAGEVPQNSFALFLADNTPAGPFWEKFTLAHEVA